MTDFDVVIIGGGLAGLTAALDLSQSNLKVVVFEKNHFPHHKVCGEYVSNEVLPYLNSLGIIIGPQFPKIKKFRLCTLSGKNISSNLPLGGFGISRYCLDNLLYKKAKEQGVEFRFEAVTAVSFKSNQFQIQTKTVNCAARVVFGCHGKRSNLDKFLQRKFIQKKSPWLGIKAHYNNVDFPDELVALGTFNGGYGGLSKVENGKVNFCYLVNYQSFKKVGSPEMFNKQIVGQNPMLKSFLDKASLEKDFNKPISISQISFKKKRPVEQHVLMCGDTAGLIHPLCGNGMAMAITSARLAVSAVLEFFDERLTRFKMERQYANSWSTEFSKRLWFGRRLQHLLLHPQILNSSLQLFGKNDRLIQTIIAKTHSNPQLIS